MVFLSFELCNPSSITLIEESELNSVDNYTILQKDWYFLGQDKGNNPQLIIIQLGTNLFILSSGILIY